jgi:hypothetical protein
MSFRMAAAGRRCFLRLLSGLPLAAGVASRRNAAFAQASRQPVEHRKPYVAIQIGAVSFVDEGTERVLDILQEKAKVNTLWLCTFTYDRGTGGRQMPSQPLPDHGVQAYDTDFHGGAFYDYDPKLFANTILDDFRAPDHNRINILQEVLPKAKARGIDVMVWDYNNAVPGIASRMKNWEKVAEIDLYGRRAPAPCFNNPDYRNQLFGRIEDYLRNYPDIAGIAWGCERVGPFLNSFGGIYAAPFVGCFCPECRKKARERDISVERARAGYIQLENYFRAALRDERPSDGYFVAFWRLLLDYPEILAWEKLWTDSYHEVRSEIYGLAKAIAPEKPVGWHIMHAHTMVPFYRAEEDFAETRRYSDFVKPVVYNNCAGPRMATYIDRLQKTIFHDARQEDILPLYYKIMNYQGEASYDKLPSAGLSPDYVLRETRRVIAGVGGGIPVYPGIDINVPTGLNQKRTTPDDVRLAVKAAFAAGAPGVVLSRKYSEMRLDNLAGAGRGLQEAGIA